MRKDKKVKAPQQYESFDYEKFQFIGANRELSEHHVQEVMDEIVNKNLSEENPVKVNSKFEIIDVDDYLDYINLNQTIDHGNDTNPKTINKTI